MNDPLPRHAPENGGGEAKRAGSHFLFGVQGSNGYVEPAREAGEGGYVTTFESDVLSAKALPLPARIAKPWAMQAFWSGRERQARDRDDAR